MPIDWINADWPAPDNVVAGTSTRIGGVSDGEFASLNLGAHVGDENRCVLENRRRLADTLQLPAEPLWLTQVHGTQVASGSAEAPEADASVAARPGQVLALMTADCLPVLFCSDNGDEIGAAHCGWRGLAAGVLENTLDAMRTNPGDVMAWLGPAISQSAFEVGDEVREAFVAASPGADVHFVANERGRWQADLVGLARLRLSDAGVTRVFGGQHCTYTDRERFFSYRRDGQTGRMGSFVLIRA